MFIILKKKKLMLSIPKLEDTELWLETFDEFHIKRPISLFSDFQCRLKFKVTELVFRNLYQLVTSTICEILGSIFHCCRRVQALLDHMAAQGRRQGGLAAAAAHPNAGKHLVVSRFRQLFAAPIPWIFPEMPPLKLLKMNRCCVFLLPLRPGWETDVVFIFSTLKKFKI